jgi:glutamate carboxypeptidase
MNPQALIVECQGFQLQMLETLEQLVDHESPSTHKPSLDRLANFLQERFKALGAEVVLHRQASHGDHVQVNIHDQDTPALPPALVLCHYDTVWPLGSLVAHPFRVEQKKACGPGSFDMKASIVMVEFALRAIRSLGLQLPRPVMVLLTSDEEIGSPTSRGLIEQKAREASYVLVMEPPGPNGALKTARKGVGSFLVEIEGRAAHAGTQPEQGINAIQELAHQIHNLHRLNDSGLGTTVNVGVVRGGTRRNVIPARAEAEVDVRAWTLAEAARLGKAVRGLTPVTQEVVVRVSGGFARPPMERSPAIAGLFQRAREIGLALGLDLTEAATGGGSDANLTAALGVPTLDGLGASGDGAHADHEHIYLRPWPVRTALLAALLLNL